MFNNELWIIYVLVFAAVLLGVQSFYWFVIRARGQQKIVNRRLALSAQLSNSDDVLDSLRRERGLGFVGNLPLMNRFDDFVTQTGVKLSAARVTLSLVGLSTCLYIPLGFWLGLGTLAIAPSLLGA